MKLNNKTVSDETVEQLESIAQCRRMQGEMNKRIALVMAQIYDWVCDNQDALANGITLPSGARLHLIVRRELTLEK